MRYRGDVCCTYELMNYNKAPTVHHKLYKFYNINRVLHLPCKAYVRSTYFHINLTFILLPYLSSHSLIFILLSLRHF